MPELWVRATPAGLQVSLWHHRLLQGQRPRSRADAPFSGWTDPPPNPPKGVENTAPDPPTLYFCPTYCEKRVSLGDDDRVSDSIPSRVSSRLGLSEQRSQLREHNSFPPRAGRRWLNAS